MSPEMFWISRLLYSIVVSSYIVLSVVCLSVCFKLATWRDSLPYDATINKLWEETWLLLTSVFSIFLFDFRKVLQLDGLPLENGSFHIFDHLFLLLAELVVSQLHSVDFLAHSDDLGLTDGGVKSILHFFLELDFTFPEEDLTLSLHNFSEDLSFLLLLLRNLVFKFDWLIFKLLQLLLEFVLNVLVLIE